MTEIDKKTVNKLIDITENIRKHKIEDFVSGIIYDCFTPSTGDSRDIFFKELQKLGSVNTLLLHTRMNNENNDNNGNIKNNDEETNDVAEDIKKFLTEPPFNSIHTETEDFKEKGRIVTISQDNKDIKSTCAENDADSQRKTYREEQFIILTCNAVYLKSKAISEFKDTLFPWNKNNDLIVQTPHGNVTIQKNKKEQQ